MASTATLLASERRFLWGYCYRLTGSAADADDLVQETMLRAVERPPAREGPMLPWLVRVATNLGRDLLRARRRRGYIGPWLPSPIEEADIDIPVEARGAEGRYDLFESVSYAFLVALEALKTRERAVLLLADVFDYSVREIADALDLGESHVKVLHHRARKKLASYDSTRTARDVAALARTEDAFRRFLASLQADDHETLEALLAGEVQALNDGGGEFFAARVAILGPSKVARFYLGLKRKFTDPSARYSLFMFNGVPAIVVQQEKLDARFAPITVTSLTTDASGRIDRVYSFLATPKLTRVRTALARTTATFAEL
jgi:RNA polymerase sigma-70 factor (ECF subfamily)